MEFIDKEAQLRKEAIRQQLQQESDPEAEAEMEWRITNGRRPRYWTEVLGQFREGSPGVRDIYKSILSNGSQRRNADGYWTRCFDSEQARRPDLGLSDIE